MSIAMDMSISDAHYNAFTFISGTVNVHIRSF